MAFALTRAGSQVFNNQDFIKEKYSDGVSPVTVLKYLLKVDLELNPHSKASASRE